MTDDWRLRARPAVYPSFGPPCGANVNLECDCVACQGSDPSDYERPARVISPSVPEGVAWRLRGLQRLLESAPLADWTIEAKLPSTSNLREHHQARAKRVAAGRAAAFRSVPAVIRSVFALPMQPSGLVVLMVRQAPRLLDSDNLAACMKAHRDGIADAMGINDRDKRVQWECEQEKCNIPSLRIYVVTK